MIGNFNDDYDFPHRLLSTNAQVLRPRKTLANNVSAGIKSTKTQLHKIGKSGGFFGRLLGQLLKHGFPLTKNVLELLAKSVLIPLGLTAVASASDTPIQKKLSGWQVWQH